MRKGISTLVLTATLLASGCCCFGEKRDTVTLVSTSNYKEAIVKLKDNIANIKSDVLTINYDGALKKAHINLLDASIQLCDDTLAGKDAK